MPRLSVLMPARNAASTIQEAVQSALRDLPSDAELIVADDGSTDDTLALLDAVDDPRLRVTADAHRGTATTLNRVLADVDSEFVARINADEITVPGRFSRQMRALNRVDVVFTTSGAWHHGVESIPARVNAQTFPYLLLLTGPDSYSAMAARRSALADVAGYRTVPHESHDLAVRLATADVRLSRLRIPGVLSRSQAQQSAVGDGWPPHAWKDDRAADAFEELTDKLLGVRRQAISRLAVSDIARPQKVSRMINFEQEYRAAIRDLPILSRAWLERVLAARAAWFWRKLDAMSIVASGDNLVEVGAGALRIAA